MFRNVFTRKSRLWSGMKINFNEDGSNYMRFIAWGQLWAQYNDDVPDGQKSLEFSTRRARILTYAQFGSKFLILAHFGLNSMNADNMSPVGKDNSSQLFFHDFWPYKPTFNNNKKL